MSIAQEVREEQKQALSTMSLKGKLAYFWDYYKIHTVAAISLLILVISVIRQVTTDKDVAFYAVFFNIADYDDVISAQWSAEFAQYAQIDTDEYQILIDTSLALNDTVDQQLYMANEQKLATFMQSGVTDAHIAETKTFEEHAQLGWYCALEDLMSAEELEKYRPYFYYTDAATFEDDEFDFTLELPDYSTLKIDHSDPSTMEQPIAVGVILTDNQMIKDSGYYTYLDNRAYNYQGHPSDVVLGIPVSSKEPEMAIRFLEYLSQ